MHLYHFKVNIVTEEITVIVAAESNELAFRAVEIEVEKSYLKLPDINEIVLVERKKIATKGTAFVLNNV